MASQWLHVGSVRKLTARSFVIIFVSITASFQQKIEHAGYALGYFALWRRQLRLCGLPLKDHFILSQTYTDVIIATNRFALHMDSHRGWAVVSGARVRDFLAISPRAKVLRVPLFVHEERGAQRSVVQCIGSSPPRVT